MGELKVQMLGGFALRMDGRELLDTDTRSKKAWILLAYLICQRENTVPQKKLIDLLWGEEPNSVNPENALRITMHRTRALLERILSEGKELCVPLCIGPGRMECRRVQDLSVLRPGSYGIPEPPPEAPAAVPEDIDLAIVPCVGAAADGRRLGRGGGYYDRFLARYTGSALLLCRERLLCPDIPREAHDICVPAVSTEKGRLCAAQ